MISAGQYIIYISLFCLAYALRSPGAVFKYQSNEDMKEALEEMDVVEGGCGRSAQQTSLKILGGEDTNPYIWPWIVGLYKVGIGRIGTEPKMLADDFPYCTATLIAPRYLLTAASCVSEFIFQLPPELMEKHWVRIFNFTTFQYLVRFGKNSVSSISDPLMADNMVKEIMFHPYKSDEPFHNIAILKLVEPVKFTTSVGPVCIPAKGTKLPAGTKCFVVGWKPDEASIYGITNVLAEAELTVLSNERCAEIDDFRSDVNICAKSPKKALQMSDLGGGLYCERGSEDGKWHIFGVSNLAVSTGEQIFTSVPVYSNWIKKHLKGSVDVEN